MADPHRFDSEPVHPASHRDIIIYARHGAAEHLFRLNALLFTAVTCMFIPAECSAVS